MKYMLDTNICIYLINEKSEKLIKKLNQYPINDFCISFITQVELQYGISKSRYKEQNQKALDEFLSQFIILPYEGDDVAREYGRIRVLLESKGQTIGSLDLLIASSALSLDPILITNNKKEFSKVPGLKCRNWA